MAPYFGSFGGKAGLLCVRWSEFMPADFRGGSRGADLIPFLDEEVFLTILIFQKKSIVGDLAERSLNSVSKLNPRDRIFSCVTLPN